LCLAEKMDDPSLHGQVVNFSNESRHTVIEIVNLILKLMNRQDLEPKVLDEASQELKSTYLSSQKAHDLLGWRAKFDMEGALQETIQWYKKYINRLQ